MNHFIAIPRTFRPKEVQQITGFSPAEQRELRHREYLESDGEGGWTTYSLHEVSRLLLARLLRDHGFTLGNAFNAVEASTVRSIVVHACLSRDAIEDKTATRVLSRNPSYANEVAIEVAGARTAGGPLFVFGKGLGPNTFISLDHAQQEAGRISPGPHVLTTINLAELGDALRKNVGGPLVTLHDRARRGAVAETAG